MKINRSSLGACNCPNSGLGSSLDKSVCDGFLYPTDYDEVMSLTPPEHAEYLACKRKFKIAEESTILTDDPSQRQYEKQWSDFGKSAPYADIYTPLNPVTKPMGVLGETAVLDESGTNLFAPPPSDEAKRARWSDWLLAVSVLSLLYSINRGK